MTLAAATQGVHEWYALSWVEWVGVGGVLATLVGLVLTWVQAHTASENAKQAKTAAEAAAAAVDRTQRQLRSNQILILVPQLRWIAQELDAAIADGNSPLARRSLDSWRWQASHVNGVLTEESPRPRKTLRALQESVALAAEATTTLLRSEKSVLDSCDQARGAIGVVCDLLTVSVGQSANQVADAEGDT